MEENPGSDCNEFELSGRVIVCKKTGKELAYIQKEMGFTPTEADAMAHYVVEVLNKKKDFKKYYANYMDSDSKNRARAMNVLRAMNEEEDKRFYPLK